MKKILFAICIICIAFTMQSCPVPQNVMNTKFGVVYILSAQDTTEVRYSDAKYNMHERILYPSAYLKQTWYYPEQHNSIKHSTTQHELHVRRITSNEEIIVIESPRIYINDEGVSLSSFTDPSDTICEVVNIYGQIETIVIHKKPVDYKLSDIIRQLEISYPNLIHRINDNEEHNFSNYQVTMDQSLIPRIYINKE